MDKLSIETSHKELWLTVLNNLVIKIDFQTLLAINENIKILDKKIDVLSSLIDSIKQNRDELAEHISSSTSQLLELSLEKEAVENHIKEDLELLNHTSFINLYKRLQINRQISATKKTLNGLTKTHEKIKFDALTTEKKYYDIIEKCLSEHTIELKERVFSSINPILEDIVQTREELFSTRAQIYLYEPALKIFSDSQLYEKTILPILSLLFKIFDDTQKDEPNYNDTKNNLFSPHSNNLSNCKISLSSFIESFQVLKQASENYIHITEKNITKLNQEITDFNYELTLQENKQLTSEELQYIGKVTSLLSTNHAIINLILSMINEQFSLSSKILKDSPLSYQYQSFVKLLLLFFHYGPLRNQPEAIFIDEGQNYSLNEYRIIQRIFDKKPRINVFGDTNQLTDSENGNSSWTILEKDLNSRYYELNENYRNTTQMTNYCNKYFDYKHTAIGIDGQEVLKIKANEIERHIKNSFEAFPDKRIALISKRFTEYKINYPTIFTGNIKDATGLEFDIVFFDSTNCTKNEQYIGMTRALHALYLIVK